MARKNKLYIRSIFFVGLISSSLRKKSYRWPLWELGCPGLNSLRWEWHLAADRPSSCRPFRTDYPEQTSWRIQLSQCWDIFGFRQVNITNPESVEVASGGLVVNADDDRLDEEVEFGGTLHALRIRAGRIVSARQHWQCRVGASRVGEVVEHRLEHRRWRRTSWVIVFK